MNRVICIALDTHTRREAARKRDRANFEKEKEKRTALGLFCCFVRLFCVLRSAFCYFSLSLVSRFFVELTQIASNTAQDTERYTIYKGSRER
jgi:hypothetical protein